VEQQKKEKEAVQAANEATLAQLNEQHNLVRCLELKLCIFERMCGRYGTCHIARAAWSFQLHIFECMCGQYGTCHIAQCWQSDWVSLKIHGWLTAWSQTCTKRPPHHGQRGTFAPESKPLRVPQKRGIEEEIKALRTEHHLEKENVLVQYRALLQEVSRSVVRN
jgi:hypothetical protein